MKYMPTIFTGILEAAFNQLEDADYKNYARVFIGNEMILVDKDDFEELREFFGSDTQFENIVNIKED